MLLLVDLDGVVYRGPDPVPGMPALLTQREAAGDIIVYVTNNSRWHRSQYLDRLLDMGAPAVQERILTSARGTALAMAGSPHPPRCAMVLGGPGLERELRDVGLPTVQAGAAGLAEDPDAVVVGVDCDLDYERLSAAASAVRAGAFFVATNRDAVFPGADGLEAGAGAMVAAVAVAARKEPDLVVGKPEPGLMLAAAKVVGLDAKDAVVIGDGPATDILAAHAVGARSVLMLTGVTTVAMAKALPAEQRPTVIARDAAELGPILDALAA
ncbi:MAG: HAD-IIA family hydrolase [Chloroflexota bacterium]